MTNTEPSAFGNPFMWTGQRHDVAIGLYHFPFRTYSPRLGRWLQRDPLGYVDGVNMYAYAGSSPTNLIDPLGLTSLLPEAPGSGYDPMLGPFGGDDEIGPPLPPKPEPCDDGTDNPNGDEEDGTGRGSDDERWKEYYHGLFREIALSADLPPELRNLLFSAWEIMLADHENWNRTVEEFLRAYLAWLRAHGKSVGAYSTTESSREEKGSKPGVLKGVAGPRNFRNAADDFHIAIGASSLAELIERLVQLNDTGIVVSELHIFDHGTRGGQAFGPDLIVAPSAGYDTQWPELAAQVMPGGTIYLYGCHVADSNPGAYDDGPTYLSELASTGNRNVVAYTGLTKCPLFWWFGYDFKPTRKKEAAYPGP